MDGETAAPDREAELAVLAQAKVEELCSVVREQYKLAHSYWELRSVDWLMVEEGRQFLLGQPQPGVAEPPRPGVVHSSHRVDKGMCSNKDKVDSRQGQSQPQ